GRVRARVSVECRDPIDDPARCLGYTADLCSDGVRAPDGRAQCWRCGWRYPGCRADRPIFHEYFRSRFHLWRRLERHSRRIDTGATYYPQSSRNAATWRSLAFGKVLTSPRRESTTPGDRGARLKTPPISQGERQMGHFPFPIRSCCTALALL